MDDFLMELKHLAKQCLAAALFITLLIGASAAALTLLAAGISTLSSSRMFSIGYPDSRYAAATAVPNSDLSNQTLGSGENVSRTQGSSSAFGSSTSNLDTGASGSVTTPNTPSSPPGSSANAADGIDGQVEHVHSPIGEALNNGGVVLGDRIQQAFGNMMAGILQMLFLERNDTASAPIQGVSANHANGGTNP